jgi:hypothetical protein
MKNCTDGQTTVAIGDGALDEYTGQNSNVGIGHWVLSGRTGWDRSLGDAGSFSNVWIGDSIGHTYTNTPMPWRPKMSVCIGSNSAFGYFGDVAIGAYAGYGRDELKSTDSNALLKGFNVAIGREAGARAVNVYGGVAIGLRAGWLDEGNNNIQIGEEATTQILTPPARPSDARYHENNIVIGNKATVVSRLDTDASCTGNIALGFNAQIAGSASIAIGASAAVCGDNSCAIGQLASVGSVPTVGVAGTKVNNLIQIGSFLTSVIQTSVAATIGSDLRLKADVVLNPLGLEFINKLTPRQYRMRPLELTTYQRQIKGAAYQPPVPVRQHNGFIAQEVKQAADEMGCDFAGFQDPTVTLGVAKDGNERLSLVYQEFISPMVKAIQELSQKLDSMAAEFAAYKSTHP